MVQDAFTKLEPDEVASLIDIYNPLFEGSIFDPLETTIMAQNLSFYPGFRYLDIGDYTCVPSMHRYCIDGPDTHVVLDWSNEPIYRLNQEAPIVLNEETVCEYVRFFFKHVRGKNGRFLVVENVDDIRWRDTPPPAARKTIGEMIIPVQIYEMRDDGTFDLKISVMFKDSLFECDAEVKPDGLITLSNEKLLVEDMPVLDNVLGQ